MKGMWIGEASRETAVVFIHGILSNGRSCWTHKNGTVWPNLIASHFGDTVGVYVFTYKTSLVSGGFSVGDITASLWEHFRTDEVLECKKIIFVCHSMGGIVARKFILKYQDFLRSNEVRLGLFLIGSPSIGSRYATILAPIIRLFEHSQGEILRFSSRNVWLNELDVEFNDLKERKTIPILGKELIEDNFIVGRWIFKRQVVEPFAGARYFGMPYKVPNTNHFTICKVANAGEIQHKILCAFIAEFLSWADDRTDRFIKPPKKVAPPARGSASVGRETRAAAHNGDRRSSAPFQAPKPPRSFIERPESTEALKKVLLKRGGSQALVVSAIQGLGGVGKTALASYISHDPDVQEAFADGILWATLGQQPDLQQLLINWIQALGDFDFKSNDLSVASKHLQSLLHNRANLLVVDDVWSVSDAQPFIVGGQYCKVILTTRLRDLAHGVHADLFEIGLLSEKQAVALIEARLGRTLAGVETAPAKEIIKDIGYLPLAIELVAAQVARGVSWSELIGALRLEVAKLEALETPRNRRTQENRLEACFNLSLDHLQKEDEGAWKVFIKLGILPEDTPFDAAIVSHCQDIPLREAEDILELLYDDALVMRSVAPRGKRDSNTQTYRLHDLLYDIAKRRLIAAPPGGLGSSLRVSHRQVVENYERLLQRRCWASLPDDGYIRRRLFYHLAGAGAEGKIEDILEEETPEGENAWYTSNDNLGYASGFVDDVEFAAAISLKAVESASPGDLLIGRLTKYALSLASINSIASNSPPELMVARVKSGRWLPEQALTYARLNVERERRLEALSFLMPLQQSASATEISQVLCAELVEDKSIKDENVVGFLARDLPVAVSDKIHERLTNSWRFYGIGSARARAISKLSPYLAPARIAKLLSEVLRWGPGLDRIIALSGLAPYVVEQEIGNLQSILKADIAGLPTVAAWARIYANACVIGMQVRLGNEGASDLLHDFLESIPEKFQTKRMICAEVLVAATPGDVVKLLDCYGVPDDLFVRTVANRLRKFGVKCVEEFCSLMNLPYHKSMVASIIALEVNDSETCDQWTKVASEQTKVVSDADSFSLNRLVSLARRKRLLNEQFRTDFTSSSSGFELCLAAMVLLVFGGDAFYDGGREKFSLDLIERARGSKYLGSLSPSRAFAGANYLLELSSGYTLENISTLFDACARSAPDAPGSPLSHSDRAFILATKCVEAGVSDGGWKEALEIFERFKIDIDDTLIAAIGMQSKSLTPSDILLFGDRMLRHKIRIIPSLFDFAMEESKSLTAMRTVLTELLAYGRENTRANLLIQIFFLQCLLPAEDTAVLVDIDVAIGKISRWWKGVSPRD